MATDNPLRSLFEGAPTDGIDVADVVRRSRARRRPRLAVAAAGSALAATALIFTGVGLAGGGTLTSATDTAGSAPMSDSAGGEERSSLLADDKRYAASQLNRCGEAVIAPASTPVGLGVSIDFAAAVAAGAEQVEGTVTLTNTGDTTVVGQTVAAPTISLVSDGTVVWHSTAPHTPLTREISLAPGESLLYSVTLSAVVCGPQDELGDTGIRDNLPPAPSGTYEVYAAIDLEGDGDAQLITGGPQTITIE